MIYADKTFYNGKIYTMNAPGEVVSAMVVRDGRIVYAGTDDVALAYPAREKEDLGGRVGIPGFSDTHIHTFMDCSAKSNVMLYGATTMDELVRRMKAGDDGGEDWLFGGGIGMSDLVEQRYPNRYDLDKATTDRPALIFSHCLHFMMVNSKGLEMIGVTKERTPNDELLTYFKDGEPDGVFREAGYTKYISPMLGELYADPDYRIGILRDNLGGYPARGLTTLHCISGLADAPPLEFFDQYCLLEREGALPVRTVINSVYLPTLLNPPTGFGTDMVKVGAKKIYTDGSLGGRTAAMLEPYADDPEAKGDLFYSLGELTALLKSAYDAGVEAAVHAIGDAAVDRLLTAAEAVYPKSDEPDPVRRLKSAGLRRLRVIHASVIADGHIERMRRLPVILDVQPNFINTDGSFIKNRLGDRLKYYSPIRSFMDAGLMVTGGSDAPVDPADPLLGIECAVTRRSADGTHGEILVPEEAVSVYDAVSMYTRNAAYCSSEEDVKGTISAGKFADFILLDTDIFEMKPEEYRSIHDIRVLRTTLGGRTTWES